MLHLYFHYLYYFLLLKCNIVLLFNNFLSGFYTDDLINTLLSKNYFYVILLLNNRFQLFNISSNFLNIGFPNLIMLIDSYHFDFHILKLVNSIFQLIGIFLSDFCIDLPNLNKF